MARKFLTPIDLSDLEIQNVKLQSLASNPSSGEAKIYWNSASKEVRIYNGTAWVALSTLVAEDVDDRVANLIVGGSAVTATYDDNANTLTLDVAVDNSSIEVSSDAIRVKALGITDAMLAGSISNAKLATNPLARANHTGTQTASTISDFDTQVRTSRLDQMAAPTASVSLNNQKITSLATPTDASDAATKGYVDAARSGLDVKQSVRAATTADITLSGTQTIDGVSVIAGDRVLVKNQSTGSENGIYVVDASTWSRSTDADSDAEVTGGLFTFVEEGTANADTGWVLTTNNPITVGSTALTFAKFSSAGEVVAGDGLTQSGQTINVVGTADRITANANSVDIASTYAGQNSITTVGTIGTGTWQGTAVGVSYGGTGATTAADARSNLGATGKYATSIGNGTDTTYTVTHNLNTLDVVVSIFANTGGAEVITDVVHATVNTITVTFAESVASNAYRVVVVG